MVVGAATFASGCSGVFDVGPTGWIAGGNTPPVAGPVPTPREIAAQPNGVMRLRMGLEQEALLTEGDRLNGDLHWLSPRRTLIATRRGRVVKTVGLAVNLRHTRFLAPDPVATGLHRINGHATTKRLIDIEEGLRFGYLIDCWFEVVGATRIRVLQRDLNVILVKEHNELASQGWNFVNSYWVDPSSGFVWRSIQHMAPEVAPLDLTILKPPTTPG